MYVCFRVQAFYRQGSAWGSTADRDSADAAAGPSSGGSSAVALRRYVRSIVCGRRPLDRFYSLARSDSRSVDRAVAPPPCSLLVVGRTIFGRRRRSPSLSRQPAAAFVISTVIMFAIRHCAACVNRIKTRQRNDSRK